jgi:hypothetical protein
MSQSDETKNTAVGFGKLLLISAIVLGSGFALMSLLNYATQ